MHRGPVATALPIVASQIQGSGFPGLIPHPLPPTGRQGSKQTRLHVQALATGCTVVPEARPQGSGPASPGRLAARRGLGQKLVLREVSQVPTLLPSSGLTKNRTRCQV